MEGSSIESSSRVEVILISPKGVKMSCVLRFCFKETNKQVEYEVVLTGLRLAKEVFGWYLLIYNNSQLIVNQINSKYQTKGETMIAYLEKVKGILGQFDIVVITQVPRSKNSNVDALARLATNLEDNLLKTVPIEVLETSIIKRSELIA